MSSEIVEQDSFNPFASQSPATPQLPAAQPQTIDFGTGRAPASAPAPATLPQQTLPASQAVVAPQQQPAVDPNTPVFEFSPEDEVWAQANQDDVLAVQRSINEAARAERMLRELRQPYTPQEQAQLQRLNARLGQASPPAYAPARQQVPQQVPPQRGATLDDVLRAMGTQQDKINQLLAKQEQDAKKQQRLVEEARKERAKRQFEAAKGYLAQSGVPADLLDAAAKDARALRKQFPNLQTVAQLTEKLREVRPSYFLRAPQQMPAPAQITPRRQQPIGAVPPQPRTVQAAPQQINTLHDAQEAFKRRADSLFRNGRV